MMEITEASRRVRGVFPTSAASHPHIAMETGITSSPSAGQYKHPHHGSSSINTAAAAATLPAPYLASSGLFPHRAERWEEWLNTRITM